METTASSARPQRRRRLLIPGILIGILLGVTAILVIYLGSYYHADDTATDALVPTDDVNVYGVRSGVIAFEPAQYEHALIFYPGGKVEYTAYAPLLRRLAENGVLCLLVRMPGNLAVLSPNRAKGLQELFPNVKDWWIGGHSLGGVMAASFISTRTDTFHGLVLLAAYSTQDLTESGLSVLSVYGTEDGVLNREQYEKHRSNLPADFTEVILQGGCHAQFGNYGAQSGDGTPTITAEEQQAATALAILAAMEG